MNYSRTTNKLFARLKYFFYNSLLKFNGTNKKFIRKKIFYGSLLITVSASLFYGCPMGTCHKTVSKNLQRETDSLLKDSVKKDSINDTKIKKNLIIDSIKNTQPISPEKKN
jgi:hypothetical protein